MSNNLLVKILICFGIQIILIYYLESLEKEEEIPENPFTALDYPIPLDYYYNISEIEQELLIIVIFIFLSLLIYSFFKKRIN